MKLFNQLPQDQKDKVITLCVSRVIDAIILNEFEPDDGDDAIMEMIDFVQDNPNFL